MRERRLVQQKKKEFKLKRITEQDIKTIVGHSETKLIKTPLGEKIVIYTSKPGILLGKRGENTANILKFLKKKIELDNPEIEVREVKDPSTDPKIIAEKIGTGLERFGVKRARWLVHKSIEEIMGAKAMGAEIRLTGKIQGGRSKSLRVHAGYLKKCGEAAKEHIRKAERVAKLKLGIIGIKVKIMPQDIKLGDKIQFIEKTEVEEQKEEKKPVNKRKTTKKKETKEKTTKTKKEETKKEVPKIEEEKKEDTKQNENKKETETPKEETQKEKQENEQ